MRVTNRFTKGSGAYVCRCCGRTTRDTGRGDNEGVELCVQCYELAGIENGISDGEPLETYAGDAKVYLAELKAKGGDLSKWRDVFPADFFPDHQPTLKQELPVIETPTKSEKTLSTNPRAVKARARRAALRVDPAVKRVQDAAENERLQDAQIAAAVRAGAGVFGALAGALSAGMAEGADSNEAGAITARAIGAASAAARSTSAALGNAPTGDYRTAADDNDPMKALYKVGEYKGRAGAMFCFMERIIALGGAVKGVSREKMIDSCRVTAPHYHVQTRAQVLDYFAWCVRKGLLVPVKGTPKGAAKDRPPAQRKGRGSVSLNIMGSK